MHVLTVEAIIFDNYLKFPTRATVQRLTVHFQIIFTSCCLCLFTLKKFSSFLFRSNAGLILYSTLLLSFRPTSSICLVISAFTLVSDVWVLLKLKFVFSIIHNNVQMPKVQILLTM